jgi:hypothetical protein
MTKSRLLFRLHLNDMPIAENSRDLVSSEHPQLLIVCLLLGLLLCGGIVLYTNQVKGNAALLAQDSSSGVSAAEIIPPSNIIGASPVPGTVAIDRSQHSDASLNARRNKQSGIAANHKPVTEHPFDALSLAHGKPFDALSLAHGKPFDALSLAHGKRGRNELASQRVALSKPGSRKLFPTLTARGRASLTLPRSHSRSSFPSHHRTTLIALWRQSLKRHQNDKMSHLTSNPST